MGWVICIFAHHANPCPAKNLRIPAIHQNSDKIFIPTESVGIDMSGQDVTSGVRVQMRAFRDLSRGAFCFLGFCRASFQGFGVDLVLRIADLWSALRGKLVMQPLNQSVACGVQPGRKGSVVFFVDDDLQARWIGLNFGDCASIG